MAKFRWCVYRSPDAHKPLAYHWLRKDADREAEGRNVIHFANHGTHGGYWVRRLQPMEVEQLKRKAEAR